MTYGAGGLELVKRARHVCDVLWSEEDVNRSKELFVNWRME